MNKGQRLTAFFGALLVTFGITDLDFENPGFELNQRAYIVIGVGLALLIVFIIQKINSPKA